MTNPTQPRWLELQMEIDYELWQLAEFRKQIGRRSAMDVMIDKASGYEDALMAQATELVAHIGALQTEFFALVGES